MATEPNTRPVHGCQLIVTRPAVEAGAWVNALEQRGWQAVAWPLIDIGPPRDPLALADLGRVRKDWFRYDALMFVSTAAVEHFFGDGRSLASPPESVRTRFWCPGPGTARALVPVLQRLGLAASHIDAPPSDAAQFDSEHLWPVVQPQLRPGMRLLVVRGRSVGVASSEPEGVSPGNGREWLMASCREQGAYVDTCVAYERLAPAWDDARKAQAMLCIGPGHLWLFSSSEAVTHLRGLLPVADWLRAQAMCTHERIAQAARDAGFGRVLTSRPALDDVLRVLESAQGLS